MSDESQLNQASQEIQSPMAQTTFSKFTTLRRFSHLQQSSPYSGSNFFKSHGSTEFSSTLGSFSSRQQISTQYKNIDFIKIPEPYSVL